MVHLKDVVFQMKPVWQLQMVVEPEARPVENVTTLEEQFLIQIKLDVDQSKPFLHTHLSTVPVRRPVLSAILEQSIIHKLKPELHKNLV
jgi:hypothetical protein